MLLGKRSRPVMRRTTSMSMLDLGSAAQHRDKLKVCGVNPGRSSGSASDKDGAQGGGFVEQSMMMVQPVCTNNGLDNGAFLIPHGSPLNAPPVATAAVAAAAATTTFCGWNFNAAQQQQHHRRFKSEPAHFLQVCFLCKRRLAGRDIYMYRGENAFCSIECRQQQIILDERTEKATNAKDNSTNQKNQKGSRQKPRAESLAAAA